MLRAQPSAAIRSASRRAPRSIALHLAWPTLVRERWRTGLSVLGVGLATMLVLLLDGFSTGIDRQLSAYLDHAPGPIVAAQTGVTSSFASSVLPPPALAAIAATPGVARTVPISAQLVVVDLRQGRLPVYLVGYDRGAGGGPWSLAAGREPRSDTEIVLDSVLASRQGLAVGDRLDVMGRSFQVVGLSEGATSWMFSFVFVQRTALAGMLGVPGTSSFTFVSPTAGTSRDALVARLGRLRGVSAETVDAMKAEDYNTLARIFKMPLNLMTLIAWGVGVLVIGLVVYSAAVEHRREFGVLKAVGSRNRGLYAVVAVQSIVASLAGAVLGFGLVWIARAVIMRVLPQYLIAIELRAMLVALAAGLLMALAGALVPARLVARIAPAEAMRGGT